jgi:hypothetical protein
MDVIICVIASDGCNGMHPSESGHFRLEISKSQLEGQNLKLFGSNFFYPVGFEA